MFPVEAEKKEVERWCATLIARPDTRMEYGVLLVSESTGVGKTTLGSHILAPLVGIQNVGWPSEGDITNSDFNDWIANKRLVVVSEIYSGHSWKAYHSLKSMITDREITVNQKYQRRYVIDNWCHIIASSNSMRALKMEEDDRRWFYPEVTEVRWPREKFVKLRNWLDSGGLGIIKTWAKNYKDYVQPGERAPMTGRKKELIRGSRSEAQSEAAELAEALIGVNKPIGLAIKDIVAHVRASAQGKVFDSDYEIRKTMTEVGAKEWPKRIKIHGRMQYVVMNDALWDAAKRAEEDGQGALIRDKVIKPSAIMETSM
jgi:hypothetical protein